MRLHRTARLPATAGGAAAVLTAAAAGAVGYYARRIVEAPADLVPRPRHPDDHVVVRRVDGDTVVLEGRAGARRGVWGLAHDDGYARVTELLGEAEDGADRRRLEIVSGEPPAVGAEGELDAAAYPPDPTTVPVPFEQVSYDSPLGPAPAWLFSESGADRRTHTWAVHVHGRSTRYHEAFRLVPALAAAGLPSLAIAYRNDPDGPRVPDGRSRLGATEWRDVEAAVRFALERGARDVILIGYSMGGTIAMTCAVRSAVRSRLRALVLDAPVLDWTPVMRRAALERGLPAAVVPLLIPPAMMLASRLAGFDWDLVRHDPAALTLPTLLVHGEADPVVPIERADVLASARPELVTYLRVPSAGHVRSWNHDPEEYEATLRGFLVAALARPPRWSLL